MPRPLLIVFGLNGSLVQRARPVIAANISASESIEQHTIGIQKVFVRPGAKDGLKKLIDAGHSVAIWSSTTLKNTEPIVKTVFGESHPFSFVWSRDHTRPDVYRRQNSLGDSETEHATIKDLSMLWKYKLGVREDKEAKEKFPEFYGTVEVDGAVDSSSSSSSSSSMTSENKSLNSFGPENTIVVDDEPSKTRAHADNLLWLPQYTVEDSVAGAIDPSLGFNQAIEMILGELSETDDVRKILPRKIAVKAISSK